jgi:hypothetical protein
MGLLSEFKGLEYKQGMLVATGFLGMAASGFIVIFQFRPELIEKYDIFKIIFLSLSLTMPLAILNAIQFVLNTPSAERNSKPTPCPGIKSFPRELTPIQFVSETTRPGLEIHLFCLQQESCHG